jgi:glutathione S-transferase
MPTQPTQPIKLYRNRMSGHCHRIELFLSLLELPCELIDIDLRAGEQKQAAFLALNALGQVPVMDDAGTLIADSNAILIYLAHRYAPAYLPTDAVGLAQLQRWLSVAAGPLTFGAAAARRAHIFTQNPDTSAQQALAQSVFKMMEDHLQEREFLLGAAISIADLALYTYTAIAPEGGISLAPYPQLRAWLSRIEALPRFVPMPRSKAGLQA